MPTPHDVAQRYYVPGLSDRDPGQRLLEVRFALPQSSDLHNWALRPVDSDTYATFGIDPHKQQSILEAAVYAPESRHTATFRVGQGLGPWRRASIPPTRFVLKAGQGEHAVVISRPSVLDDDQERFEVRDAKGSVIPSSPSGSYHQRGRTLLWYRLEGRAKPVRVALWTRPYAWTTISDVPLVRPKS